MFKVIDLCGYIYDAYGTFIDDGGIFRYYRFFKISYIFKFITNFIISFSYT